MDRRNNAIRDQGTLTCPPGSYAFATSGQSGKSVDRVSGLTCRNIYTGAVSNATGNAFGGGGGKASTKPIDCGGDALTGFWFNSKNYVNLDGFGGVCRVRLAAEVVVGCYSGRRVERDRLLRQRHR